MEKAKNQDINSIRYTSHCFEQLIKLVIQQFTLNHNQYSPKRVTQLYGFGNYDPNEPNLKSDFEKQSGDFVNGKYLYDKNRALESGKIQIKINSYYSQLMVNYIGYQDFYDFIDNEIEDVEEKEKQLEWLNQKQNVENSYYISYHFGENKQVIKGQVEIYNDWKNVKYKYIYHQNDGTYKEFHYQGQLTKRVDIIHIRTKTLMDNKLVDSGEDILYAGHIEPNSSPFLIGTYNAFDIYNRVIAGKLIFEKFDSKDEMIEASLKREIPNYIIQEIRNQLIMNNGRVPNSSLEISSKSPFASTYEKLTGSYQINFSYAENGSADLQFNIDPITYKISSATEGCIFKKDDIDIIQNGSVVHFSFQLLGLSKVLSGEIFFKSFYLNQLDEPFEGVFSGMDHEGKLINGKVSIVKNEMPTFSNK
ncbi:hypothetical protein [Flammeovirga sp. SJP92]|uniref:hypothetical protein n=1 Tax=Flammeovirga sp. SJP92 TaxID=1775430 RepID=UPI0007868908|nr:hypothetical protein [Flammeovirga sp. SJP92]KXX68143.1 hypothetical protein AVL50_20300 [Flammeovirga sp. SJP92]